MRALPFALWMRAASTCIVLVEVGLGVRGKTPLEVHGAQPWKSEWCAKASDIEQGATVLRCVLPV